MKLFQETILIRRYRFDTRKVCRCNCVNRNHKIWVCSIDLWKVESFLENMIEEQVGLIFIHVSLFQIF